MPDVRFALESRVLATVLDLPEPVQKRLAGTPIVVDGLTLAPELQVMLRLQKLFRLPAAETLPLAKARAELLRQQRLVGGLQHVGAVRELEVDGAEGPLRARLYTPTERMSGGPAPTMLFIHGGGWMYGDLESHDPACRFLAERSGCQLLAIDYRLAPEHKFPAATQDCQAAYRWLVEHADEVNADPTRLAVGGDSAGASLATSTAVYAAEQGLPLALQLLIYPGTDFVERTESRRLFGEGFVLTEVFMTGAEEAYFAEEVGRAASASERPVETNTPTTPDDRSHPDASPLRRTDFPEGLAPAYVVTAGFDPLRDEGEAYARLLAGNGVEVEAERYPSLIHGFLHIVGAGRECKAAVAEIADRLRSALA